MICVHGNEPSSFIKGGGFLDKVNDSLILKNGLCWRDLFGSWIEIAVYIKQNTRLAEICGMIVLSWVVPKVIVQETGKCIVASSWTVSLLRSDFPFSRQPGLLSEHSLDGIHSLIYSDAFRVVEYYRMSFVLRPRNGNGPCWYSRRGFCVAMQGGISDVEADRFFLTFMWRIYKQCNIFSLAI